MKRTPTQRTFVHGALYALSRLSDQGVAFLLVPIYARYLGREGYGMLALVDTTTDFAALLIMQGQLASWYRLRFRYEGAERRILESTILWYVMGSLAVGIGLSCLWAPPFAERWLPGVAFFPFLLLGLLASAFGTPTRLYERSLQADERPRAYVILRAFRAIIRAASIFVAVVLLGQGVEGKLTADVLVALLLCALALAKLRPLPPWQVSRERLKESLAFGLPFVFHAVATTINGISDRWLINYYVGTSETGLYAMGYKVASIGLLAATALNQGFSPVLARTLTEAPNLDPEEREKLMAGVRRGALYQVTAVACLLLALTAIGREVILVATTAEFEAAYRITPLIAVGVLLMCAYQPASASLIFHSKTRWIPFVSICGASVNVVLNIWWIPTWGIAGAAVATAISNGVFLLLALVLARRVFVPFAGSRWLTVLAIAFAGLACIWYVDSTMATWLPRLAVKLLVFATTSILLAAISGARLGDLTKLLRRA